MTSNYHLLQYYLTDARSKLKTLQDLDGARLNKLRGDRPDVYRAVIWLRENKHRFKATIHEPPILSVISHFKFIFK